MRGNYWYWKFYWSNYWGHLADQRRKYGWRSFLPHRHIPHRIPAGDGYYCYRCGTRKAIVQKRGDEGRTLGRHARKPNQ